MAEVLKKFISHFAHHNSENSNEKDDLEKKIQKIFKENHTNSKIKQFDLTFNQINQVLEHKSATLKLNETINFDVLLSNSEEEKIKNLVLDLKPWHKGIYEIGNLIIDGQWDCFYKWLRIKPTIEKFFNQNSHNLNILDIGCGNGYFLWRIKGVLEQFANKSSCSSVLGIDRHLLYFAQFYLFFNLINQYKNQNSINFLPLDDLELFNLMTKNKIKRFDLVLSMGVLYHQKDPLNHLSRVQKILKDSDSLFILETLITPDIDNLKAEVLFPKDDYCKMKNVWFIPNLKMLHNWLEKLKFSKVEVIDVAPTSPNEQRMTNLSQNWGISDAVDFKTKKTVEGFDAPMRVILAIRI